MQILRKLNYLPIIYVTNATRINQSLKFSGFTGINIHTLTIF